jgi:antitoxin ParD1/3/4
MASGCANHVDNSCQLAHDSCVGSTSTMNIALPEPLRAYVAQRVESGEYGNTSEYVRDLIRKDRRDQQIQKLRRLVEDGLSSGPATPDTPDDWNELKAVARGDVE